MCVRFGYESCAIEMTVITVIRTERETETERQRQRQRQRETETGR